MEIQELIQFVKILNLLNRPQGVSYQDLCKNLEVSDATARRIIKGLEENYPLQRKSHDGKSQPRPGEPIYFHIEQEYMRKFKNLPLDFSADEIWFLGFFLMRHGQGFSQEFEKVRNSLFQKISALVVDRSTFERDLMQFKKIFSAAEYGKKSYLGKEVILQDLSDAIMDRLRCKIKYSVYSKGGNPYEMIIEPLHLYSKNGGEYLLVNNPSVKGIRILAVERIQTLETLEEKFLYPENFDAESYSNRYFGISIEDESIKTLLHFSKQLSPYIQERQWAVGQKITKNSDGTCVLEMEIPSRIELLHWILGKGPGVRVLEPADLREEIARLAGVIAQTNQEDSGDAGSP